MGTSDFAILNQTTRLAQKRQVAIPFSRLQTLFCSYAGSRQLFRTDSASHLGKLGVNDQSAVSVAALVSVVVVLVPLVCRVPVAGRRHLRHDLAAELGLHRRDDLLRRLLLLLGVVKDGAPGGGERVSGRGDDGKR